MAEQYVRSCFETGAVVCKLLSRFGREGIEYFFPQEYLMKDSYFAMQSRLMCKDTDSIGRGHARPRDLTRILSHVLGTRAPPAQESLDSSHFMCFLSRLLHCWSLKFFSCDRWNKPLWHAHAHLKIHKFIKHKEYHTFKWKRVEKVFAEL